jgi:exosortase/archaeosortase family protein
MDSRLGPYAINAVVVFAGLLVYLLLINFIVANADLSWLQRAEAYAVYSIQNASGIAASYNETTISVAYSSPAFSMDIIALCTGIAEMLFFAFLVLLVRGPRMRERLKGLALFLPLIFLINIGRLLLLHPMAAWLGVAAMWDVHWLVWKYGMFCVLMALFAVWYLALVGRKG